ncbi:TonB-dependent receptor plug domain-containing protein [Xanthomonas sacchari]|uniref:TonB-dependent receptor n=1 Tax=Xanthomonas sacchari TaxID=56458 RepID=A0A2P5Z8V8_9XANT|nr:TonB-dependent receptor [Xanthomonas sacchari]MDV0437818.1 TonB-dependent receptor [Xanthomonas sacchari]PPU85037.1 TonB-dependent receptor [Xanthomonas sacchari]
MNCKTHRLRDAIAFALAAGTTALLSTGAAAAQDSSSNDASKTLDTIQVTGSRVARVETETASPVVVIDRAAIEQTGKLTLGDLVQELPAMSGAPSTPAVNNGGGDGKSSVDLRGLGDERTLLLVNGRRVVNNDVNSIPASAVERIEVLTSGASAVYGSDAVAGVVNFILRKDFEGLAVSVDYGQATHLSDGARSGGSLTFGQVGDRGNIMVGLNYNKFDGISSADRKYSKDATYLYSGAVTVLGSSRNPRGRITVPTALRPQYGGCSTVTLKPGATGASQGDYRCYSGATDSFNYQATNLIMTPQERTNAFFLANYQITDSINAFAQVYHNKTSSNFAIAPLPFDARGDKVVISANNFYNPFGTNFGADEAGNQYNQLLTRFTSLGQRRSYYSTVTDQVVAGLEGFVGDSTWKWDAAMNYGHYTRENTSYGYVYYAGLRDALGPSFRDTDGVIKCGSAGAVIAGCTPLNIFNINDPQTIATLGKYEARPTYSNTYQMRSFEANANGELFTLPAGASQLAVGVSWREEYQKNAVDYIAIANANGNCFISQEACGTPLSGKYNVKELYAELYVPLLSEVPFAHLLALTLGSRYSDYNTFGNTTNSKVQLEWRPIQNLLLRGTVAEVFRAPTIENLYSGASGDAPNFADPCIGYGRTGTPRDHEAACGAGAGATAIPGATGITPSGMSQTTGVWSGSVAAGFDLKPEQGKSFDWGVVYDPEWLPGFSASLDYWRLYLNDTINRADAQTVADICYSDNNSPFCGFINRYTDGQVNFIREPIVNLGRLDTKGWDLALRYRLPDTAWGSYTFGLDGTYIARYDNKTNPDDPAGVVTHVAGTYNKSYGLYSRVRGRLFVNWQKGDLGASWRIRYVGPFDVGSADPAQNRSADAGYPNVVVPYGSYFLHSVSVNYALPWFNSKVEVGLDNVFDKQPPMLYQNNVLNANTDVNSFDTVGRYLWARYSMSF